MFTHSDISIIAQTLNEETLRDGMNEHWQVDDIVRAVLRISSLPQFDWIITFDQGGVSGHPNHIAIASAVKDVALALHQQNPPRIWTLPTYSVPFKYTSLPGAIWRYLYAHSGCFSTLLTPTQYLRTAHIMKTAHASQFVWFRYLWFVFSTYVWGGSLCEVPVRAAT